MDPTRPSVDLGLWGKWGDNGAQRYALLAHLLDSASVAQALFDRWLPPRLVDKLDHRLVASGGTARQIVVTAAGLHDLGKINPYFQGQLLGRRTGEFAEQTEALRAAGYWLPSGPLLTPSSGDEREFVGRHEIATTVLLRDELDEDPDSFACVVGGHHGKWNIFGTEEVDADAFPVACGFYTALRSDPKWTEQVAAHQDEVLGLLGTDVFDRAADFDRAAVPFLTSIVCLADWIASSEESVTEGQRLLYLLERAPREFSVERRRFLDDHVATILGIPHTPKGDFKSVFGFEPSRPVQVELVRKDPPGLTVVMVPMGEGKTEAALGHWMLSATEKQGIYFALPTMATADAMFDRVRAFFANTEDPVLGGLSHGRAVLNAFYQPSKVDPTILSDLPDGSVGLVPQDWFTGRHRALLAPVSVGTIDQLLSGALRHRYNFLRLLGLATKTIILDEVHTYDPYMSALLCSFLEWAGWLELDVVLLSATLSAGRLTEYVEAYRRGQGSLDALALTPTYPSVVRVVGGAVVATDLSDATSGREVAIDIAWEPAPPRAAWKGALAVVRRVVSAYPGAKVGVIMNTVGGAQSVAAALVEDGLTPGLLHARMPAFERAARAQAAICEFGKDSVDGPAILAATQVVEASIDLDFDILVTEVCPAASLLQRCGRVWRHDLDDPVRQRSRPGGLTAPLAFIIHPDSFPENSKAFLPYLEAEIVKTLAALDEGTATRIAIPGDVQRLVDAADVQLADLDTMGTSAEDAVISKKVKQLRGREASVPGPAAVTSRLAHLADFTRGELGDEERATRLNDLPSAVLLPIAAANRLAWSKDNPLPKRPTREQVLALVSYTIPVSGAIAGLAHREVTAGNRAFSAREFDHRLLSDIIVVDLDDTDLLALDDLLGLSKR